MPVPSPAARTVAGPSLAQIVGERTVPHLPAENYWFRRHEIAYRVLAPALALAARPGATPVGGPGAAPGLVLEAGSGEGYGVQLLRRAGVERVIALDYDAAALAHARSAYPEDVDGRAVRTNLARLPLADGCAAAIVGLQVIEHLWTPDEFLAECARVLRPGGLLAISTPNRITFSPGLGRGQKPPNPFHSREFDAAELSALIGGRLEVTERLGVRTGPRLRAWEAEHTDLVAAQLATPADEWPDGLREVVTSVTADDFVLELLDEDLLAEKAGDEQIEDEGRDAARYPDVLDLVVLARRR